MTISLIAPDFESLKSLAQQIVGHVAKSQSYKAMPISGGSSSGDSFSIIYECPTELRINELRREADELEKNLGSAP